MAKKYIIKPEILEQKKTYESKYVSVREDRVLFKRENEDGKIEKIERTYYISEMHNFVIVIVKRGEEILLVNQYRYPVRGFCNEFVAGIIENDDDAEETAKKELLEEAGIKAEKLECLGKIFPLVGQTSAYALVYLASGTIEEVSPHLEIFEKFSNLTSRWVSIKQFRDLVASGKINNASTLAAWALLSAHMEK